MKSTDSLIVFQDKNVRRIFKNPLWYFSVTDIIHVLTDSKDSLAYWRKLKQREPQLVTLCHGFKMPAQDRKMRLTDCVSTENALRLIQSIPSKKAEPFKLWLAKVGYERIKEIEDPELALLRMRRLYEEKGYSKIWIDNRMRGIAIRQELTEEWLQRGVKEGMEFAILTNEISKATFGKTVQEYKSHKGLDKEQLRDHMTDLELIYTMLGEKVTEEVTVNEDKQGLTECENAAKRGGRVAGDARKNAEKEIGCKIVTKENHIDIPEKVKRKQVKKSKKIMIS